MNKTRQCRKCRKQVDLNLLKSEYVNDRKRWFCKDSCNWYTEKRQPQQAIKDTEREIEELEREVAQQQEIVEKALLDDTYVFEPEYKEVEPNPDKVETYVITAAQNNTLIHTGFLNSLKGYCYHNNAELLVIPFRYRNSTSVAEEENREDWWDRDIASDLVNQRILTPQLAILADISINPTAINPLSGLEALTGGRSGIVAHPQISLRCIPTPKGKLPHILTTTGALTRRNYTNSKSGKKGEFHHSYGAVVLQVKGDRFHIRNLSAKNDGSFIDLGIEYSGAFKRRTKTSALVMGDLHIGSTCPLVAKATEQLISELEPEVIALHDAFDGESVNHHEEKNPFAKFGRNFEDLEHELDTNAEVLNSYSKLCKELVLVNSNHNDFIFRWLQRADWRDVNLTPRTAQIYLEAALQVTNDLDSDVYAKEMLKRGVKVRFLELDESYLVNDIELGFHGHLGSNGSRGSSKQYSKTGMKTIIGHAHCLPGNYLVQTKANGWKEIKALNSDDLVLSYDWQSKTNVWKSINKFHEYDYDDLFIQIQGNGFEQTFTKEHMLRLEDGSYIPAHEAIVTRSASELPLSAQPLNDENIRIEISDIGIQRAVCVANDGSKDSYRVRFHFKKQRKIDRLKKLWGSDLVAYRDEPNYFDGYVSIKTKSYKECRKLLDQKGNRLGRAGCLDLNTNQAEILVEELRYWDGTFDTGCNARQWSTTVKGEANIVQSLLTRLGYSNSRTLKVSQDENQNDKFTLTWCADRSFVRSTTQKHHEMRFNSWGFFSYHASSKVYCLSLDTKCFWVRSPKTGQVSLTGNSPSIEKGCYQVGTSTHLSLGYTKGLSSWLNTHCVVYDNNKRQLIHIIDGEYCFK